MSLYWQKVAELRLLQYHVDKGMHQQQMHPGLDAYRTCYMQHMHVLARK